jgi:hypothetical protein
MADRGIADANEPKTSPKAVPVGDKNHEDATEAPGQSNEGNGVGNAIQKENDAVKKAASDEEMGENGIKKEHEKDTKSSRGAQRTREKNFRPKRQNNSKFDPSVRGVSSDAQEIRNLVG